MIEDDLVASKKFLDSCIGDVVSINSEIWRRGVGWDERAPLNCLLLSCMISDLPNEEDEFSWDITTPVFTTGKTIHCHVFLDNKILLMRCDSSFISRA